VEESQPAPEQVRFQGKRSTRAKALPPASILLKDRKEKNEEKNSSASQRSTTLFDFH